MIVENKQLYQLTETSHNYADYKPVKLQKKKLTRRNLKNYTL